MQLQHQRKQVEAALEKTTSSAELDRKVIRAMQEALKLLKECRANLRKAAAIVSLDAYRNIIVNMKESEAALKKAQADLRKHRGAADHFQEELPRIDRKQEKLQRKLIRVRKAEHDD